MLFDGSKDTIVSVAEMRAADAYTIASGTPSKELMFRAATGVFDSYDGWENGRTAIFCGSGNNGGDGYALALILKDHGCEADVFMTSSKFSEDGRYYYEKCVAAGIWCRPFEPAVTDLSRCGAIVDCMLGTGFKGFPRAPISDAIAAINEARRVGAFVISVDINSGMNGDTGEAELAVASDLTVSIGFLKTGFFRGRADELIGRLVNTDIGIVLPPDGHC